MILDSMYTSGWSILYLTPAWAAKLTTTLGLYSVNVLLTSSLSARLPFIKVKFSYLFRISSLYSFNLTS